MRHRIVLAAITVLALGLLSVGSATAAPSQANRPLLGGSCQFEATGTPAFPLARADCTLYGEAVPAAGSTQCLTWATVLANPAGFGMFGPTDLRCTERERGLDSVRLRFNQPVALPLPNGTCVAPQSPTCVGGSILRGWAWDTVYENGAFDTVLSAQGFSGYLGTVDGRPIMVQNKWVVFEADYGANAVNLQLFPFPLTATPTCLRIRVLDRDASTPASIVHGCGVAARPTATPTARPSATPTARPSATPTAPPAQTPTSTSTPPAANATPTVSVTTAPAARPTEVRPSATPTLRPSTATPTPAATTKPSGADDKIAPSSPTPTSPAATPTRPAATPTASPAASPTPTQTSTPAPATPTATATATAASTSTTTPASPTSSPTPSASAKPGS